MERMGIYESIVALLGNDAAVLSLMGLSLLLSVISLALQFLKGRTGGGEATTRDASSSGPSPAPTATASGIAPELVAVITAAVAAASGRKASEIRIARITPSVPGTSGLNTPVWGYANRLANSGR